MGEGGFGIEDCGGKRGGGVCLYIMIWYGDFSYDLTIVSLIGTGNTEGTLAVLFREC